ncbi:MAG: hypothetical protein ACUVQ5_02225 [Candidatus Methanomethylicaceae archaeon]
MREAALLALSKVMNSEDLGVVTRFVVGAMLLSHGVRADAKAHVVFDGTKCITFDGKSMRNVRPDEQSLSGILRAGIKKIEGRGGGRVMPGIFAKQIQIQELLREAKGARLYYAGGYGRVEEVPEDFFVIFGYPGLEIEEELLRRGFLSVKLGRVPLLPDQAVVLLNNRLDRRLKGLKKG